MDNWCREGSVNERRSGWNSWRGGRDAYLSNGNSSAGGAEPRYPGCVSFVERGGRDAEGGKNAWRRWQSWSKDDAAIVDEMMTSRYAEERDRRRFPATTEAVVVPEAASITMARVRIRSALHVEGTTGETGSRSHQLDPSLHPLATRTTGTPRIRRNRARPCHCATHPLFSHIFAKA